MIVAGVLVALLALIGVVIGIVEWRHHATPSAPPHATRNAAIPVVGSTLAVPVYADLSSLQRLLDHQIPETLWTIDQPGTTCVAPQRLHLLGAAIPITPRLTCEIVGTARRGPIVLHGEGADIVADLPVLAEVHARDVGGIIHDATATGRAMVHAHIRLAVARDWRVRGTIRLAYDWSTPPGIRILGQRITFTDKADARLRPVMAQLEQKLPAELAKLDVRARVGGLWAKAFTVVSLNGDNPPVWMRIVPQAVSYGGYAVVGRRLQLNLGLRALTQAVVGRRPADPAPTPLPDMSPPLADTGVVRVFAPVVAEYDQLVPVIARALARREQRPFDIAGKQPVRVHFEQITVWGAPDGRIAVGAMVTARPVAGVIGAAGELAATRGHVWFVARPRNASDSQLVHFTDLTVTGDTNRTTGDLLLDIANSPGFSDAIADALTQNFTRDFQSLLAKIHHAVADRHLGDFAVSADVQAVHNGQLEAYANGLYLPVRLEGRARVAYAPARANGR